jgi:hypothetical protein
MGILLRDTPAPWPPHLRALREKILAISGLDKESIEGAAIELTVGIEMCREDLLHRNPSAAFDPYQEFLTFAECPGLDYSDVDGSEIASLTPYQMYMAVAWCYTDTARWFATRPIDSSQWKTDKAIWQASSYEFAARQLIQLACGVCSGPC